MTSQPSTTCLFVYGTLRKQDATGKIALLGETRFLGLGKVTGLMLDLGDYPGVLPSASTDDWVVGEVYELQDFFRMIPGLDAYEGCDSATPAPHEYRREITPVTLENGEAIPTWIYWYQGPTSGKKRLISGDWLSR